MLEALSLTAYIGRGKECRFRRSIMLSRRRAIEDPKCRSGKCLGSKVENISCINLFKDQTRIIYQSNLTKGTQLCINQSLSMNVSVKLMKESEARDVHRSVE